ncbi:ketoacyl-ACP synthase III [bacterium]|nr:ketoacyl-ACP synthase III [bacterium]
MAPRLSAQLVGTGSAVPERVLGNEELSRLVETSDEWITTRTGIKTRHIAADHERNSDFAALACERALADAGCPAETVDYVFVGTVTGDLIFPSTACLVQAKIGAHNAAAWDLSAACSGFLFGLEQAAALLETGRGRRALVVGSELLSRLTNWQDRATCVLFGDGAGAVLLEARPVDGRGILASVSRSDGRLAELLNAPQGGSAEPPTPAIIAARTNKIQMKGNEVFKHAVRNMAAAAQQTLAAAGLSAADLALFIPHQANMRIIDAIGERLAIPAERVYVNIAEYGNTSAASIPIALDEARRSGRIGPGDYVLMATFGGGLTWGATLMKL